MNNDLNPNILKSKYMVMAIKQAKIALSNGEIPIGCVLVNSHDSNQIFIAHNTVEENKNCINHAEINVINQATDHIKQKYLSEFDMYITLEPCYMCAFAISITHIKNIYFGAYNTKTGALSNNNNLFASRFCSHKPNYFGGIHEEECEKLLNNFFENKRKNKNQSI